MKIEQISLNGCIQPAGTRQITALDAGFNYGLAVFETFRVSNKQVFLLDQHLARLQNSLDYLQIKPPNRERLAGYLAELVDRFDDDQDLFVRLMISAGSGDLGLSSDSYDRPNVIIYACKIDQFAARQKPAKILSSSRRQLPEYFNQTQTRLKTNDYLNAHLAQSELASYKKQKNFSPLVQLEGILLSPSGKVCEALTSNIFWVDDGQIYTSPLNLGILPGIIRSHIIKKFAVKESKITAKKLKQTDEIFLTNSVNYICALETVDEAQKPGNSGQIYQKISKQLAIELSQNSTDIHSFLSVK